MNNGSQYTEYMSAQFQARTSALKTFYCREDIQEALTQFQRAKPDSKPFRFKDLQTMCQARGLDVQHLLANPAVLNGVPTREALKGQLLDLIYELHREAPTPGKNMERIVRHLAPEYSADPVRTAILKKYLMGLGFSCKIYPTEKILSWAAEQMTSDEKCAYQLSPMTQRLSLAVGKLNDSIFAEFMDQQRLPNGQLLGVIRSRWLRLPELDILLSRTAPEICGHAFSFLRAQFPAADSPVSTSYEAMVRMAMDHGCRIREQQEELRDRFLRQQDAVLAAASEEYAELYQKTEQYILSLSDISQIPEESPLLPVIRRYHSNFRERSGDISRKFLKKAYPALAAQQEAYESLSDTATVFFQYLFSVYSAVKAFQDSLASLCVFYGLAESGTGEISQMLNALTERPHETPSAEEETRLVQAAEKTFRQYLNLLFYKTAKSAKCQCASDLLKYDIRDARNANRSDYELLYLCDALDKGAFYSNGKTRAELYRFAILFRMSIALLPTDVYDPQTDMVKRLFEDYYNDNLTRYLTEDSENPQDSSQFEAEPSGEGINFKNFVEVIYLYYLYRKDLPLTPGERISHAQKTIDFCVRRWKRQDLPPAPDKLLETDRTPLYQERFLEQILSASERDLPELILQNYHFHSSGSRIQYSSQANTAYDLLAETLEDLDELERTQENILLEVMMDMRDPEGALSDEDEEHFKQLSSEAVSSANGRFLWDLFQPLTERYRDDPDFIRMIRHLNGHLTKKYDWVSGRKLELLAHLIHILCIHSSLDTRLTLQDIRSRLQWKALAVNGDIIKESIALLIQLGFDIPQQTKNGKTDYYLGSRTYEDQRLNAILRHSRNRYLHRTSQMQQYFQELIEEKGLVSKKVTRTTLIAAYANRYAQLVQDTYDLETFGDLYEDFLSSIDPLLREARFQPINEKNILDLYVIVALYYYFVNNGKIGLSPSLEVWER